MLAATVEAPKLNTICRKRWLCRPKLINASGTTIRPTIPATQLIRPAMWAADFTQIAAAGVDNISEQH
jgi:hypothetical protein